MVIIEPITRHNAMIFKEVRLRALQDTPSAFGSTYAKESQLTDEEWVQRATQWSGPTSTSYLAMEMAMPCGLVAGFLDREEATRTHLISMWVSPTHRRLGVGRLLVESVLSWARDKQAMTLWLMVTCNNSVAIRFYEQLGFTMTGRTEPYPNDPSLFEYEMFRAVS
jgi:ribosomal protein S18 acetylase RimI-like enzyme